MSGLHGQLDRTLRETGEAKFTPKFLVWLTKWHVEQLAESRLKEKRTWFHMLVFEEKDKFIFELTESERLLEHVG